MIEIELSFNMCWLCCYSQTFFLNLKLKLLGNFSHYNIGNKVKYLNIIETEKMQLDVTIFGIVPFKN